MEISKYLREHARTIKGKQQLIIDAYARALEVIPRQLCDNAGFDSTDILNKLRMRHARGETWAGVDIQEIRMGTRSRENQCHQICYRGRYNDRIHR